MANTHIHTHTARGGSGPSWVPRRGHLQVHILDLSSSSDFHILDKEESIPDWNSSRAIANIHHGPTEFVADDCHKGKLRVSNWADINVSLEHTHKKSTLAPTSLPREHQSPQMATFYTHTRMHCLDLSAQEGWRGSKSIVSNTIPSQDSEIPWDKWYFSEWIRAQGDLNEIPWK